MILDIIKNNKTLRELMAGIIAFGIIGEIIILIFDNRIYNSSGFFIGIAVSLFCAVHMAWSVDIYVSLGEKAAVSFSRKYTVIRYLVMCAVLAVIGITDIASPVTLIIGYMGLKAGAYFNPVIHKILSRGEEKQ